MIIYNKKRTIYALLISIVVIVLFIFAGIPSMYNWYYRKISPFFNLSMEQVGNNIHIFSPGDGSGKIIQTIDQSNKKLIFTLTGANEEIKSINEFPINGNIGYEMCYQNKYGEYCFGKTK